MRAAKLFAGPGLMFTGILHFVIPRTFQAIVPDWLPAHRALVYASGVAEFAAGAGTLHPRTRRRAGQLGILTMVSVYPANVDMALHPETYDQIPAAALYARLPLQGLFIYWIWKVTQRGTR